MRDDTLPLSHFEQIYERGPDPWRFASSPYEAAKYAATLEALPRARYAKALEVGCSIGVLTGLLAQRCDDLLAIEPVEKALDAARQRNAATPSVRFAKSFVPAEWPAERFDLVLLSEVLDYLGKSDLNALAVRLEGSLDCDGDVVLVHWLGKKKQGAVGSGEASDALIAAAHGFLRPVLQTRNADYRLDVLTRRTRPENA